MFERRLLTPHARTQPSRQGEGDSAFAATQTRTHARVRARTLWLFHTDSSGHPQPKPHLRPHPSPLAPRPSPLTLTPPPRWHPELHGTVTRLLRAMLAPPPPKPATKAAGAVDGGDEGDGSTGWLRLRQRRAAPKGGGEAELQEEEPPPLRLETLAGDGGGDGGGGAGRASGAACAGEGAAAYHLLSAMVECYRELPTFPELFGGVSELLAGVPAAQLPAPLRALHVAVAAQLREAVARAAWLRVPLRLQSVASVAIRSFNPAFEDDFQPRKNMDPDRERAELAGLKRLHTREKKGAVRELRKDALFIARQRQAEEDKTSDYLAARGKRSMSIMQDQEANWKSMKREKSGRGVKPKKEPGASI